MVNVIVSVQAPTIRNLHQFAANFGLRIYAVSASAEGRQWQLKGPDVKSAEDFQRCLPPYYSVHIEAMD